MFDGKLRHLSGSNQQDGFTFQCSEYFSSQLHCCKANGHRPVTDTGFGADPFGDEKGPVQETVENDP